MNLNLDPKHYNLNSRLRLAKVSDSHIAILKKRKSRIIMKDGRQLVEQVNQIKSVNPALEVSIMISGPICSKTKNMLQEQGIGIIVSAED